jgi:hypothetical protein
MVVAPYWPRRGAMLVVVGVRLTAHNTQSRCVGSMIGSGTFRMATILPIPSGCMGSPARCVGTRKTCRSPVRDTNSSLPTSIRCGAETKRFRSLVDADLVDLSTGPVAQSTRQSCCWEGTLWLRIAATHGLICFGMERNFLRSN